MKHILIILTLILISFFSCKKENKIAKQLSGTKWNIILYNRAGGYTKSDFSSETHTFEFFPIKKPNKAYTSIYKGAYLIDYADTSKVDWQDTFQYQLKGDDLEIISVIKYLNHTSSGAQNKVTLNLWRKRFKIIGYNTNLLTLTRTDSTDLYIKAIKQ